jgi:LysR family glycine cleavage system transcriptional activator
LLKLPLLHMAWPEWVLPPITWSAWKQAANEHGELDEWDTEAGVVFSDETHAISAAIAGQGVALVSETVVAQELQSGLLQAPLECGLDGCGSHWVVPKSRANEAKLQAVGAWVTAACAAVMGNVA